MCHAAKALGGEAQAVDVVARPLAFLPVLFVANMASNAISSSLILVIHDNMIIGTNHIVLACLCRHF
jgi:hypothetical protein